MHRDFARRTLLPLALLGLTAVVALAEGPTAVLAPEEAAPEVRAERAPAIPPLTEDEQALLAVRERGRLQVEALAEQIRATPDPTRRSELQTRIIEIKRQTQLEFLRLAVDFARRDGDARLEKQALALIEAIEHPPRPVPSMHLRQTPRKQMQQEGGSR